MLGLLASTPARAADAPAAQPAAAEAAVREFNIAPGPLEWVLTRFAAAAGVALSFDPALVADRPSAGLRGRYSSEDGLRLLLKDSGLVLVRQGAAGYVLARSASDGRSVSGTGAHVLPPVRVTGHLPMGTDPVTDGTGSYFVNAVSIGKTPMALRDIPQSVSVITRQQMDDQNMVSVDQALRQVTGVTTNLYGDTTAGYMARGYTLQTQYDGVPASAGLQMTPQFDLAMYDRIEVLRGANGLLQGAGNPSGSVNFVRKRPTSEFAGSASVSAGRYDNYHADLDVGGPLNAARTLRARSVLSVQDKRHVNGVQANRQVMGYAALDADLSPDTTLSLSGSIQRKHTQRFMGIPTRTSTGQPVDSDPSDFYGADGGDSSYPMSELLAEVTHRLGASGWMAHAAVRYKKVSSDLLYGYVSSSVSDAGLTSFTLARSDYDERSRGADISVSGPFTWLGRQHNAVIGFNYDHYLYEGGGSTRSLTNQALTQRSFDLESAPAVTTLRARRTVQSGLYGSARLQLSDALTLSLGGRFSDYAYETRTLAPTPTTWTRWERAHGQFTPYGGLVWRLSPTHSAYVSYTDIFSPQDAFDTTGRLPAKVGWQLETGLKSQWFGGRLNTSAALYRIHEKNRAVADTVNTGCDGDGYTCYRAAGLVESQGLELEAIGRLAPGWDLSAGYTYNANEYLRDGTASNVGQRFSTTTPRHMLKLWTNYRLPLDERRWQVGAGVRAQSETSQALTASVLRQGGYAVMGAQVGYRLGASSLITLTIDNLADRRYYERLGNRWGYTYYGDPRNVTLTLRTVF